MPVSGLFLFGQGKGIGRAGVHQEVVRERLYRDTGIRDREHVTGPSFDINCSEDENKKVETGTTLLIVGLFRRW